MTTRKIAPPRPPGPGEPPPELHYRAVRLPSGALLPIEVRLGRRLLRTLPADSPEALRLLEAGRVEILSPR
ncbi:MAG: hypothetical protein Q9Q40_04885 [Acidobacteriota bacterium]|nr:hypothetical protein [Acidobacteriota bacterium]MDQ7087164.1 hypothetical protein [Acidobacteriota bacterium]